MTAIPQAPGSDVAKPGTTPADPTSRPIISTHTAVIDLMVSATPATAPQNDQQDKTTVSAGGSMKSKITPSSTSEQVATDTNKESDEKLALQSNEKKPEVQADQSARIAELIDSGEYNVAVNQKSGGSVGQFMAVVLGVVLIAVIILYLLIDLDVIDVGVNLPVQLFK